MKQINWGVFVLLAVLWPLAIVVCGMVSGPGLLAFLAGSALVLWGYWRLVVSRPRYAPAMAFVGTYLGQDFYLEVA